MRAARVRLESSAGRLTGGVRKRRSRMWIGGRDAAGVATPEGVPPRQDELDNSDVSSYGRTSDLREARQERLEGSMSEEPMKKSRRNTTS